MLTDKKKWLKSNFFRDSVLFYLKSLGGKKTQVQHLNTPLIHPTHSRRHLFFVLLSLLVTVTNGLFQSYTIMTSLADNVQCSIPDIRSHYSVISAIFCRTSISVTYGKCITLRVRLSRNVLGLAWCSAAVIYGSGPPTTSLCG